VNGSSCCHTLFCIKNIGHLLSNFIVIATINIIGDNIIIAISETIISKILFKTIDRPSNFECLYSIAIKFEIFSGL